jgi:hypothetical protein
MMAPARKRDKPPAPEEILAEHSPVVRDQADRLRRLIKDAVPEVSEAAYPGWHAIGFRHPTSGYFCGIFPQEESLDLAFEYGVLLPDPQGVLRGGGKQVRYVHLGVEDTIPEQAIRGLIEAALNLPDGRQARQDLRRAAAARSGSSRSS